MGSMTLCGVLLCVILWACVEGDKDDKLFMLEISLPPLLGRNEASDISAIKQLLSNTQGVNVTFALKKSELGYPVIIAVVEVENDCTWASVTSVLASRGDKYSAIPLYHCEDFARAMNVTLNSQTKEFDNVTIFLADLVFYAKGYTTAEYTNILKSHLETTNTVTQDGTMMHCYRDMGYVPIRMFHFTEANPSENERLQETFKVSERFHLDIRAYQHLYLYPNACPTA
ncbi:uncharacterized protein [Haliotis cracherodii]|uniref:uncharacterized protein n=1 Tax=Haliotis cracherodii TaxID=6455 RepID=UPI0039EA5913